MAFEQFLMDFSVRCDKQAAMYWLPHFLSDAFHRRRPSLVLISAAPLKPGEIPEPDQVIGAVLFHELVVRGIATRIVATDDRFGFRTVFALPEDCARVTAAACEAFLEYRAHLVLAIYEDHADSSPEHYLHRHAHMEWTSRKLLVGKHLVLKATYEETLQTVGKSTRFNLRYYRRRLEKEMAVEFVADATPELTAELLQQMSAGSRDPVTKIMCLQRWQAATTLPGSFLLGLRTAQGRWLGLIGGWRHEQTTVLQWQMNRAGMDRQSIGTVLRAFFIEHEVHRGARLLVFHDGTRHTISHAFERVQICKFALRRRSILSTVILRLAKLYCGSMGLGLPTTHITDMLCDMSAPWHSTQAPPSVMPAASVEK